MCSGKVASLGHAGFIDISEREMAAATCERHGDSSADAASGSRDYCSSSFKSHLLFECIVNGSFSATPS
jgi:hypothetical protein